jgi:uncharacterized secreted protein with C-terminal beta-propeller domain
MEKRVFLVILFLGAILTSPFWFIEDFEVQRSLRLRKFSSYYELKSFLKRNAGGAVAPHYGADVWRTTFETQLLAEGGKESTASQPDFSTTNIQVQGVDEADMVKTDGRFIYVGSGRNVTILKAYPPETARLLSKIPLNGTLKGLFIDQHRLVVLEQNHDFNERFSVSTSILVYDVIDKMNPVLVRHISTDGFYFDSRMIDDYVYVLVTSPAYIYINEVALPKLYLDSEIREIDVSSIYYSNVSDYYYSFTTVLSVNIWRDQEEPDYEIFLLGAASNLYVSLNSIYITIPDRTRTFIHKVRIDHGEIAYTASGEVPGYVLNQFSMDEYNGYFRIATTTGRLSRTWVGIASQNHIYVLDTNLNIVGKLENLAPGEKIYSARFMGDRCYLVTFRKVDPLFVVDLANPLEPKVLGQLKITGYSDYLHPYDENHIIGIGKETVAAEEGNFAWYQGVKISLFDVSNVTAPKEIAKYEIGDRGTDSPVLRDHKALLFDKSKQLLVLPILLAEIDEDKYPEGVPPFIHGDFVWQGAYVFDISLENGLVLRGRITHFENNVDFLKSSYRFSSAYSVKRALYIENVLYTISDKKVKMNSLEDLTEINEIELL